MAGSVRALDRFRACAELSHSRAKGSEIVDNRLIDKNVAVGEKQYAFPAPGFPESPDNLKGGVGFAGTGGHDEKDSVLALAIASVEPT
jgi:hypothetical protein